MVTPALLPAEPVGVGAAWDVTGSATEQTSVDATAHIEFVGLDGDLATLTYTSSSELSQFRAKSTSTASGTVVIDLTNSLDVDIEAAEEVDFQSLDAVEVSTDRVSVSEPVA